MNMPHNTVFFSVMAKYAAIIAVLGVTIIPSRSAVIDSDPAIAAMPDKKAEAMRINGIRSADAVSANKIRIVIGTSYTGIGEDTEAFRIVSEDDDTYAYEKFVRPKNAKVLNPRENTEITVPTGYSAPKAGNMSKLSRTVVILELPSPMKPGCSYAVVGMGNKSGIMVTGARTAASFKYTKGNFVAEEIPPTDSATLTITGLRGASSIGNGIIMLEFGAGYSSPAGNKLANYKVTVNDQPFAVEAIGRRSRIDCYHPVGWPFKGIMQHDVFIKIGKVLADGDKVRIVLNESVTAGANATSFIFDQTKSISDSIKVNQVGYITDSPVKIGYLGRWLGSFPDPNMVVKQEDDQNGNSSDLSNNALFEIHKNPGAIPPEETPIPDPVSDTEPKLSASALSFDNPPDFFIHDATSGEQVFSGKTKLIHYGTQNDGRCNHSGENVYCMDFSEFKTIGKFFISVPGVGRSFNFEISDDVYAAPFRIQETGLFAQRCGIELKKPYSDWRRIACHTNGIVRTNVKRIQSNGWNTFPENIVMTPNTKGASDALRRICSDAALVAYFPFNGSLENALKNSAIETVYPGKPSFVKDDAITGGANDQVYATGDKDNGFSFNIGDNTDNGLAASFWFRRDDKPMGGKYGGTILSFGGSAGLSVNWGIIRFASNGYRRVGDNKWRHMLINITPSEPENDQLRWEAAFYVDGQKQSSIILKKKPSGDIKFGELSDEAARGGFFDEFRVYERPLTDAEITALGEKVAGRLPVVHNCIGGHHDAGDYNPRSHIDIAQTLLDTYEIAPQKFYDKQLNIPEAGNGIPDIVDEALWALRVWIGLQDSDGGVFNGTESNGDPNFVQTVELDNKGDYTFAKDSKGSFIFAGVMAQASRILKEFGKQAEAADYLARAEKAYNWAVQNKPAEIKNLKQFGEYYTCARAYADAHLLISTGNKKYNTDFIDNTPWKTYPDADITIEQGGYNLADAAFAYARAPDSLADAAIKKAIIDAICREADFFINGSAVMAYKFIRHPNAPISWGTGAYQNFLPAIHNAWGLTKDKKYLEWMVRTSDNTLGNNPMNTVWIVGLGSKNVHAPLHNSRYNPSGMVAVGQQVEGPFARGDSYSYKDTVYPKHITEVAPLYTFIDCHFAIAMNEGVSPSQAKSLAAFGLLLPDKDK